MTTPALEMMRCEKRSMTLSTAGCSKLWLSAEENRPKEWEGRFACLACPIGARNSGRAVIQTAGAVEMIRMMCPRCFRPAQRLVQDYLCISCYNRHCEVLRGRNAKGNRPQLADMLRSEIIVVAEGIVERTVRRDMVTGPAEIIIAAAKKTSSTMAFGRRRVAWAAMTRSSRWAPWTSQLELAI